MGYDNPNLSCVGAACGFEEAEEIIKGDRFIKKISKQSAKKETFRKAKKAIKSSKKIKKIRKK